MPGLRIQLNEKTLSCRDRLLSERRRPNVEGEQQDMLGSCRMCVRASAEQTWHRSNAGDKPPLRSELFSRDQMEQHGKTLAGLHKLSPGMCPTSFYRGFLRMRRPDLCPHPAGRCCQDRPPDYAGRRMAARQLLSDRRTDPHGQETPAEGLQPGTAALAERPSEGIPRVYDLALETSLTEMAGGPGNLSSFVAAYQTVTS